MDFPRAHRKQIAPTNPLERLNAEIKGRTDVVGILPNDAAIVRLVGALLLEQNDEWQLQRRYLSLEGLGTVSDNQAQRLSAAGRPERTAKAPQRFNLRLPLRVQFELAVAIRRRRWECEDGYRDTVNAAPLVSRCALCQST